jgi:hypothetical protein
MLLHWLLNNNACALTLIEQALRSKLYGIPANKDECFTCRLIEPVYDFKSNHEEFSQVLYVISIILWTISVYKIYKKYKNKEINTIYDLFKF